jgi:hypothetical protein
LEADFQLELGREIKRLYPTATINYEKSFKVGATKKQRKVDLFVVVDNVRVAIELKYPKAQWSGYANGEEFHLAAGGGEDRQLRLYAVDLKNVEEIVLDNIVDQGHAVLLTNNPKMWVGAPSTNNQYHDFTLPHGRQLPTQLVWASDPTSQYTVNLNKTRLVSWHHFSTPPGTAFNYLVLDA